VGRTARAELTGDAFTFVAPDEESDLRQIERAISKRLPRITVPEFDYTRRPTERFEVPIQERIAAIRARKAEERTRAREKAERRGQHEMAMASRQRGGLPVRPSAPPGPTAPRGTVGSRHVAPSRPQPRGGSRDGHVQGPSRPGHHRSPQS
jgi:ATP-dependent RNA helicase RhlE